MRRPRVGTRGRRAARTLTGLGSKAAWSARGCAPCVPPPPTLLRVALPAALVPLRVLRASVHDRCRGVRGGLAPPRWGCTGVVRGGARGCVPRVPCATCGRDVGFGVKVAVCRSTRVVAVIRMAAAVSRVQQRWVVRMGHRPGVVTACAHVARCSSCVRRCASSRCAHTLQTTLLVSIERMVWFQHGRPVDRSTQRAANGR